MKFLSQILASMPRKRQKRNIQYSFLAQLNRRKRALSLGFGGITTAIVNDYWQEFSWSRDVFINSLSNSPRVFSLGKIAKILQEKNSLFVELFNPNGLPKDINGELALLSQSGKKEWYKFLQNFANNLSQEILGLIACNL